MSLALLVLVYLCGPAPARPEYAPGLPVLPDRAAALERAIWQQETSVPVKPGNEARIVWSDSGRTQTEFSIVYLHGFSASHEEGHPVHVNTARALGANLYLSRLEGHGLQSLHPFASLTVEAYWRSAKQALAIGKKLGRKVILMGTSTGGTLALKLAADFPDDVYALVLLSPNVAIRNDKAYLLNNPWGYQVARLVTGSDTVVARDQRPIYQRFWYSRYPLRAATALQELLETSMTDETFRKIRQPLLMLYYYRDEERQDQVVSVPAMLKMYGSLSTPPALKRKKAMPAAGDHVIGSYIKSADVKGVEAEVLRFLQELVRRPA